MTKELLDAQARISRLEKENERLCELIEGLGLSAHAAANVGRQCRIIRLAMERMTLTEIAAEEGVSKSTVDRILRTVHRRLRCIERKEAQAAQASEREEYERLKEKFGPWSRIG